MFPCVATIQNFSPKMKYQSFILGLQLGPQVPRMPVATRMIFTFLGDRGFQPQRLHVPTHPGKVAAAPKWGLNPKMVGFPKQPWGFPTKMTSFPRCFWGYYHFRKHSNASACFCFPIFKELGTLLQCTFLLVRKVLFWHGTMKRHYWLS